MTLISQAECTSVYQYFLTEQKHSIYPAKNFIPLFVCLELPKNAKKTEEIERKYFGTLLNL